MENHRSSVFALVFAILPAWYAGTAEEPPQAIRPPDCNQTPAPAEVAYYRYKVVRSYPHDRQAFTQGLVYENGLIYEGTGLYGQSSLSKRNLKTGETLKVLRLPEKYFGEGITLCDDKLIQLTWKSRVGFVYSKDTFALRGEFHYPMQGWGLTHDGKHLIVSDGTAILHFLDPNTYKEISRLEVRDRGRPVRGLNELEYIPDNPPVAQPPPAVKPEEPPPGAGAPRGLLYANVWPTDHIVIIAPQTGRVTGWLDLTGLYPRSPDSEAVLNGIAYLPETRHLLVTGKLWPRLYEIELVGQPD